MKKKFSGYSITKIDNFKIGKNPHFEKLIEKTSFK